MAADAKSELRSPFANPWIQLVLGIICMVAVANMQYGWTNFVNPLHAKYHWTLPAIQWAFTFFVVVETWLVPVEGYLVDRLGPRPVVIAGGILVALAWSLNSVASSLPTLYAGAILGGIGTGAVYGTCVGNALKWFPTRRGLAAGLTAMGFGGGAAFTVIPITRMIATSGYEHAFRFFGLLQGAVVVIAALALLVAPRALQAAAPKRSQSARSFSPAEVLLSPVFWVMYLMFFLVAAGGLVMIPNVKPIAKDLGVGQVPVTMLGITLVASSFALSLQRIFDGIGRPFFGWVSDHIGRENTMAIAFLTGAACFLGMSQYGTSPAAFVLLTALYFGVFGEIYSLFPATQGDTFGAKFATANAGMLYTAKGAGALAVPFATALAVSRGWNTVFATGMICNLLAALIGLFVLKPMRVRHFEAVRAAAASPGVAPGGQMQHPPGADVPRPAHLS